MRLRRFPSSIHADRVRPNVPLPKDNWYGALGGRLLAGQAKRGPAYSLELKSGRGAGWQPFTLDCGRWPLGRGVRGVIELQSEVGRRCARTKSFAVAWRTSGEPGYTSSHRIPSASHRSFNFTPKLAECVGSFSGCPRFGGAL